MTKFSIKNSILALAMITVWGLEYSFAREGGGNRPPPYRPNPGPRPEPRPPRPNPRPPAPRPEPRPPRPNPRPPAPRPEPRPPRPYPPRPYPPPRPAPIHRTLVLDVNRTLTHYEKVNLVDYFNLYSYAGYEVETVRVYSDVDGSPMEVLLVADRNIVDSAMANLGFSAVSMYPHGRIVLRSNTYDLELMARGPGSMRIHQVEIRLSYY